MKSIIKVIALILAISSIAVLFTGCGDREGNKAGEGNTAKDIKIGYLNQGYGSDWIEQTIERFEKAYPEYNVELLMSPTQDGVTPAWGQADIDNTDLYVANLIGLDKKYFEPLDDVLTLTGKGDSRTIGERVSQKTWNAQKSSDGKVYSLTAITSGNLAMIYNKAIFKKYNIPNTPRTTNELAVVSDTLSSQGMPATCHYKGQGQWGIARYVFYAQYDGYDYYVNNFLKVKNLKGESPSIDVFLAKDGKYETLKAFETFLTPDYILPGSNSDSHTVVQTKLVQGKVAMMYNGGWVENETKSAGKMDDFGVFHLPVISTITKKLTTVKSEVDLRNVISAIDTVISNEKTANDYKAGNAYKVNGKTVSAADWDKLMEARTIGYGGGGTGSFFIPTYSTAKDAAKLFISYALSDENAKAIADNQHYQMFVLDYNNLDFEVDTSKWTSLGREFYEDAKGYQYFVGHSLPDSHPMFTESSADMTGYISITTSYTSQNPKDRLTADQIWDKYTGIVNQHFLMTWLANVTTE